MPAQVFAIGKAAALAHDCLDSPGFPFHKAIQDPGLENARPSSASLANSGASQDEMRHLSPHQDLSTVLKASA